MSSDWLILFSRVRARLFIALVHHHSNGQSGIQTLNKCQMLVLVIIAGVLVLMTQQQRYAYSLVETIIQSEFITMSFSQQLQNRQQHKIQHNQHK